MNGIFKVWYGCIWDGETQDADWNSDSKTVSAASAEHAIAAVRDREVGTKIPACDDNCDEIKGKFLHVTDIIVKSVEFVSQVDLIGSKASKRK